MFAIVVHKNIELGDHTLNNEKLSLVNTKFLINKKMTVNLENLNLLSGLKMICLFVKVDQNVYKTANKSALIYTNQIQLLSSNNGQRLRAISMIFHVFLKRIKQSSMRWNNCISKTLRFLQTTTEHQYCPVFNTLLTIKTSSQNISIMLSQISLELHEHRDGYWKKKFPWTIWKISSLCWEIQLPVK